MKNVTPTVEVREESRLERVKKLHTAIRSSDRMNLQRAKELGEELLVQKEVCIRERSRWDKWLEDAGVSGSAARDYIMIAKGYQEGILSTPGVDMGFSEARTLLRESRRAEREQEEKETAEEPHTLNGKTPLPTVYEEPEEEQDLSEDTPREFDTLKQVEREYADSGDYEDAIETREEAEEVLRTAQGKPPVQQPTPEPKPKNYIKLDEWNRKPLHERSKLLADRSGNSIFNAQENNSIEWALWSWNPVTGCRHDCPYCYARDIANRFYEQRFEPSIIPQRLKAPKNTIFPKKEAAEWMGHKNVFTCSMADLFGRWVPKEWIEVVLAECAANKQWNFLFLTKFPNRMSEFTFSDNCWVGTTVDCQKRVKNAEKSFRKVKAAVKWLSCEPLLEPLKFDDLGAFNWVVIGGSSKSIKTPAWVPPRKWVVELEYNVWKSGGKVYEKSNLGIPEEYRIREYPGVEEEIEKLPDSLNYLPQEIG